MTIQQQVFQAVRDRGYLDDWTTEQATARQVCKLQEELAELASEVDGMDEPTRQNIRKAGAQARADFDDEDAWRSPIVDGWKFGYTDRAAAELYDLQVVVFVLAELLGVDVQAGALDKARADVERGKRGARD
jgi:NTP pyrophosphatase (non-canonical NTP hydrolase)